MAKVLVTGICGFIGSNLAHGLLAAGASVRGIDNLSTGKAANLEGIQGRIDLRQADILDAAAIADACKGVETVFHQAAIPSVPRSVADPLGTHHPNVTGTLHVLEAARAAGVRRVVYAASSSAYGDSPALPKVESMLPAPKSAYAVQKLASEHYMASYTRMYGLDTVSLRYFNVFGPRQDPASQYSGVLARFISLMLAGRTPAIFGDGSTSRDFTYIDNAVSANLLAAQAGPAVAGRMFNVATGERVTLLQAYEAVRRITGYSGGLEWQPERAGDVKHSLADIAAAKQALGYKVVTGFAEGLERTIAWYREESKKSSGN